MQQRSFQSENKPKIWHLILHIALASASAYLFLHSFVPLSPLGEVLNPYRGIWSHRLPKIQDHVGVAKSSGLQAHARIELETSTGIPHISAPSDGDLYFAQGYWTARDRLWQMDFLSRVASGRVAEVLGAKALPLDRTMAEMDLLSGAKEALDMINGDSETRSAVDFYAAGVNAWIAQLDATTLPVEFRLFGYRPEKWSPLKTALVIKFMSFSLSGHSRVLPLTRSRTRLSDSDFTELFPEIVDDSAAITGSERRWPFSSRTLTAPTEPFLSTVEMLDKWESPHPGNGSNNWAVSGTVTKSGYPIVAGDVHLDYSLPALWYENQLKSDTQNVYGVSLPGAPGVVLGFNEATAWTVTNGGAQVLDWYQMRFRDADRREYLFGGDWRPVIRREHVIKVKGAPPVKIELTRTHFGPLLFDDETVPVGPAFAFVPRGLAMRWTALDASNEVKTFLRLNRAKNQLECEEALNYFQNPVQNFICADRENISIRHQGKIPVRWKGQGRTVADGTNPKYQWQGFIPVDELPKIKNPTSGFVFSANQAPVGKNYPHELGEYSVAPFRAQRIQKRLRELTREMTRELTRDMTKELSGKKGITAEQMIAMQNDTGADWLLEFVELGTKKIAAADKKSISAKLLTEPQSDANLITSLLSTLLPAWKGEMSGASPAAVFALHWWHSFEKEIWSQTFPGAHYRLPSPATTLKILRENPESKWLNSEGSLSEHLTRSFLAALAELKNDQGAHIEKWGIAREKLTQFRHLARIPGLGERTFRIGGDANSIMANTGTHGPVWKMVISLGPKGPEAYGQFPGGVSGDIASAYYDKFLDDWSVGQMRKLNFENGTAAQMIRTDLGVVTK